MTVSSIFSDLRKQPTHPHTLSSFLIRVDGDDIVFLSHRRTLMVQWMTQQDWNGNHPWESQVRRHFFNSPENYWEKHLTRTQHTKGRQQKMDTRSLFWPRGGNEWTVALKKKQARRGQKDCCEEMAMVLIFSQRCNGHRWRTDIPLTYIYIYIYKHNKN